MSNYLKSLIFIVLIIWSKLICGQDSLDNRLCIKIAPLSILDIYSGSSVRVGTEYKLKGRTALYNELGTYVLNLNGFEKNRGIITRVEFKYYFNHNKMTTGNYMSCELFYKHQSFSTWDTITIPADHRQDYRVSKDVACFTIKFGVLEVLKKHFIIDYFIGAGVRFKQAKNTLTYDENNNIKPVGDYGINVSVGQAGPFVFPNIDMGVKIGYRIK